MSVLKYSDLDYKLAIKLKLKALSKTRNASVSLQKLAGHLEMQYTYLSRVLNSKDDHLKEDTLFEALTFLEFTKFEVEVLMNQRILCATSSNSRREHAANTLSELNKKRISDVEERGSIESVFEAESTFLLDPYATIIFVSLGIPNLKNDTRKISSLLGMSLSDLKIVLEKIERAGFIELDADRLTVKKVKSHRLHYKTDHQLMRQHQQQIKLLALNFLTRLTDDRKKSFLVTFVADNETRNKITEEFNIFVSRIEQLAKQARPQKVFQISFDFFDWI